MKTRNIIFPILLLCAVISFAKVDIDVGGEVIAGWRWDSREIYPNNEFFIDRVRPKIKVEFDSLSTFSARISFDLNSGFAELKDAVIRYKYGRPLEIGIGQRRKPIGLEDLLGLSDVPAADWTEIHDILDDAGYLDRDIGVWISGKLFQEPYQIEYDLGLYNGNGGDAITSEKQFAGRLIYSPSKFVDLIGSYGTGLDTLGLEWRDAWNIGATASSGDLELGGEYIAGNDVVSNDDFNGYELWARYAFGKFQPYLQYEHCLRKHYYSFEDGMDPLFHDLSDNKKRTHLGLGFEPIEGTRLKVQASYIDDEYETPHTEITIQVHARF
ncbi:hypothetical protein KAH81_03920 [bacterium]|nr:hypothetical protein [bacterium]